MRFLVHATIEVGGGGGKTVSFFVEGRGDEWVRGQIGGMCRLAELLSVDGGPSLKVEYQRVDLEEIVAGG